VENIPEETEIAGPDLFAPLAIKLMQGVLYDDDYKVWTGLTKVHEMPLRRFFAQIGVQLIINEADGFAFLRQNIEQIDQDVTQALPRMMRKRTLTIDQSILCVLLRERIEDHTMLDTASREPILHLKEITSLVDLFFKERKTQQRFLKDVAKTVSDLVKMGFLELVSEPRSGGANTERYRIKRIIKAFIDTDELAQLIDQLKAVKT
jgi:Domain of unknown function (DUF4194)